MAFDLNDFDETLPGPFEWDLKRLAASLEVAGRDRGFAEAEREAVVRAGAASYRTAMAAFAGQSNLQIFYARLDVDETFARYQATVPAKLLRRAEKQRRQGAHQGQHAGPRASSPTRWTASRASAPTRR